MAMNVPDNISALFIAGAAGAFTRAVYVPEPSWKKRILEGIAGAMSAIFLGGLLGHWIDSAFGGGVWAYCAAAFIMGEGGIAAVHTVRSIVFRKGG